MRNVSSYIDCKCLAGWLVVVMLCVGLIAKTTLGYRLIYVHMPTVLDFYNEQKQTKQMKMTFLFESLYEATSFYVNITLNCFMCSGLGYSMVIINTLIGIYYNVIIAWTIHYFFSSMTSRLPWDSCDNWWNTENCVIPAALKNMTDGKMAI
jgi:SNF family Na+-dependent transporter